MDDEISNYIKEILNKYQKKEINKVEEKFALLMIDYASSNEIIHTKKCIDNKNIKK